MNTTTCRIEIQAPVHEVWNALSTTEGMHMWIDWVKVSTDWQVNGPIAFTICDDNGEAMEYNGSKMIFNGVIEVKKELKEITYSFPGKMAGIERESYVLDVINTGTTGVSFTQTCSSEERAKEQEEDQQQLMETLKRKLEKN